MLQQDATISINNQHGGGLERLTCHKLTKHCWQCCYEHCIKDSRVSPLGVLFSS